jgi:hypothetical protein
VDVAAAARQRWFHLAMKLGMMPKREPISLAPVLNRMARSACSSAPLKAMAASYTPGPVSVCRPSMGTPKAPMSSISALKKPRFWLAMRSSE